MLPPFAVEYADTIAARGSYLLAAGAFFIGIFSLVATGLVLYLSTHQSNRIKEAELKQKEFENALDLLRIVAGTKDTFPSGAANGFLQLASIEALRHFPDYHNVYVYMNSYYKDSNKSNPNPMTSALIEGTDRLVLKTAKK